jgi:hypothetical protein
MLYFIYIWKEEMITIEYSKEGVAVPDYGAEEFVRELVRDLAETKSLIDAELTDSEADVRIETSVSTENVIFAARVLKKEEGIDIQFKFGDQILTPDKDGRLNEWPDGFCEFVDDWLIRLLQNDKMDELEFFSERIGKNND